MKLLGRISVHQPRVAAPDEMIVTHVYIITNARSFNGDIELRIEREDALYFARRCGGRVAGYVEVERPGIMWGSGDELTIEICDAVKRHLLETGVCVRNEAGILFLANEEEAV